MANNGEPGSSTGVSMQFRASCQPLDGAVESRCREFNPYRTGRLPQNFRTHLQAVESRKRAWEETVVSAATGSIADSAVATVVSSYGELNCVDEQLEHLDWLVMEVDCMVSEAERVPAAMVMSWPLRWWLRNLRDAAREGREVARSFRLRRRSEEPAAAAAGNALWLGVRAARMALLGDDDMGRLGRALRKLERASAGMDRFLLLLRHRCDDSGLDGGAVVVPPRAGMVGLVTLYVPSLLRLLFVKVACEVAKWSCGVKRAALAPS